MASTNNQTSSPKLRVMLWTPPRSLSSVFTQCVSSRDNVEVFFEVYTCAAHGGPEKKFKTPGGMPNVVREPLYTYDYVKNQLEADYPGRDMVFAKDMADAIDGRYEKIPKGFVHTFLIRHPGRVFPSLVRLAHSAPPFMGKVSFKELNPGAGEGFKELWDLFEYVTNTLKQPAIVVDTDDLVQNPGPIMKQYCKKIGFPYGDDLLQWEPDLVTKNKWHIANSHMMGNQMMGTYKRAFGSTCFEGGQRKEVNYEDESDEVKESIAFCMPFYEKMLAHKIKV